MKKLNGQEFKKAILSGVNALVNNKDRIDTLNVFPVPDGDTGSNMGSTVEYAGETIKNLTTENIGEISTKFSRGMLLGARGNSGVIISQIMKGISVGFADKEEVTSFDIVEAFKYAKEFAYKSVMTPVEGTILTVIRMVYENLEKTITPSNTIEEIFAFVFEFARKATDYTPELLPVLKEVGVVDSGGEGLTIFLEGIHLYLQGKPVEKGEIADGKFGKFTFENEDYEGEFGYCIEFIIELKTPKSFIKEKFEKSMFKLGTSMVIVRDEEIVKIHIHSHNPGEILQFAIKYGQFLKIKIDNMTEQVNESNTSKKDINDGTSSKVEAGLAVIACNTGQGIINDMKGLGTHFIIEAGQSVNPSAQDFIKAIEETGADRVIILPNNSNIILAAQQVAQTSEKEIIVIPSKTQMQGLAAMLNFNPHGSIKDNQENMEEAISSVKTGQVTKAARTTKIEGVLVKEGEYLAISERKIIKSTKSKVQSAIAISDNLINDDSEIVTIYYGDDSTKADADDVALHIENNYDVEVEVKSGEQQVYNFLISFE